MDGSPPGAVAVLYEHPTWSVELIERLRDRLAGRGVEVVGVDVGDPASNPHPSPSADIGLWVNRINVMPSAARTATGRAGAVVAATHHLLLALDAAEVRVVNGFRCHALGASKAAQAALFVDLGLATPATASIASAGEAVAAADGIGFPVVTKPNVGGSGHGIGRYDDHAELAAAVYTGTVDLGADGSGVVQRFVESADGLVHRIEVLDGRPLYATEQPIQAGAFNYCAADGCTVDGPKIVDPDPGMADAAVAVVTAAGADIGGIEYLISADDGQPVVYDFNPYSNFVTGAERDLGFDPVDRYLDAIERRTRIDRPHA